MMYVVMSVKGSKMKERHLIEEARRNLPRLIREAEHGKTVRHAAWRTGSGSGRVSSFRANRRGPVQLRRSL